ncbi:Dipeptidyl-peptidase 5, partial [Coemansia sp. RSA 1287]
MRFGVLVFAAAAAGVLAAEGGNANQNSLKPLDSHLFHSLNKISPPIVLPDQTRALYTTSRYDPKKNKSFSFLSLLDTVSGESTQLTPEMEGERISSPMWLNENTAGYVFKGALYQHNLQPNINGTLFYNTTVGISSATYRAATGQLFFLADVYSDGNISSVAGYKEKEKNRTDSAQVFDNLWARHWNKWMTPVKANLFSVKVPLAENGGLGQAAREVNLMQGLAPSVDPLLRWEAEGYAVSSDGQHAAYVVRSPSPDLSWSTNVDIYLVPCNSSGQPELLTEAYKGAASNPVFSADGSALAWLQMETPGYESDIRRIFVHNITTGQTHSVARDWDLSPHFMIWSADSSVLYTLVQSRGDSKVVTVNVLTGARAELTGSGYIASIARLGTDRLLAVYTNTTATHDIYTIDVNSVGAPMRRLTQANRDKLHDVYLGEAEDFWFAGARNEQ